MVSFQIDDEPETTKRVKSADNIIMTIEGGPEYIILDDDDDGVGSSMLLQ